MIQDVGYGYVMKSVQMVGKAFIYMCGNPFL